MIHPDVEIVDLDPDGVARLHEVFAQERADEAWAYVLHRRGRVERVFPQPGVPRPDRMPRLDDPIDDPAELARQVHSATEATRAIVIDHDQLADLVRAAASHADTHSTLQELRSKVARTYWAHPAVHTFPPPPGDPWDDLHKAFAARAKRVTALLSMADTDGVVLAAVVEWEDGLVTSIRGVASDDYDTVRREADITLRVDWAGFVAALRAPGSARSVRRVDREVSFDRPRRCAADLARSDDGVDELTSRQGAFLARAPISPGAGDS